MLQDKKLARAVKFLEAANEDYATSEQLAQAIRGLAGLMQQVKSALEETVKTGESKQNTKVLGLISDIKTLDKDLRKICAENKKSTLDTLRAELGKEVEKLQKVINTLPEAFDPTELQNQINVLMEYETPKVEAQEVRDLLELLEGDERLDASAIKNLPEVVEKAQRTVATSHALWNLMDVDIAGITAGQTIQWDGNKWVAYTPAGSGGTPVWGEDLTPQGPGTAFTLAETPIVGTVRLFRGGAYQSVANGDYSITGAAITLTVALQSGEVLVADYSYS